MSPLLFGHLANLAFAAAYLVRAIEEPPGYSMIEMAKTGRDGSFGLPVGLPFSVSYGAFTGIPWFRSRSDPHDVVRALLIVADGYARRVHPTARATWREQDVEETGGEIVGTLDVGTIRLEPR